jgi:ABC-type transport system involved in cytochrome bd biosynthesis fused ATPase/permease subunit
VPVGQEPPPDPIAALVVERLSVAQPGRDVLAPAEASLEVRPGEIVAVTGTSGAGKSTLLAVILGLLEPTAGRVAVRGGDGSETDVRDLDPHAWRERVAWVPQVPYLFAGPVADNVRLGAPAASDAEVADALARVGLAEVSPDHVLGERGRGLSSGQRRRVGIARALVRRAPVLLLDEPTAGLDGPAEAAVLAALRSAARDGAAVLVVAHRPGAVAEADRTVEVRWAEVVPDPAAVLAGTSAGSPGGTPAAGSPPGQGSASTAPGALG